MAELFEADDLLPSVIQRHEKAYFSSVWKARVVKEAYFSLVV